MKYSLYGSFGVLPSYEPTLRKHLKTILRTTPPNTTTLNKKAAAFVPRYFTDSATDKQYMLLNTGVESKNRKIDGQTGHLFLLFAKTNKDSYEYDTYYVSTDWDDVYKKAARKLKLDLDYLSTIVDNAARSEEEAKAAEMQTEQVKNVDKQSVDEAATTIEADEQVEAEQTVETVIEEQIEFVEQTEEQLDISQDTESCDTDDSMLETIAIAEDADACVNYLDDVLTEFKYDDKLSAYLSKIMTDFDMTNVLPDVSVMYACIRRNYIRLDVNEFRQLLRRILYVEWTNWLYAKITTTNELVQTGNILVDTGFIKADGQILYSVIQVKENYPHAIILDASLTDIKMAGLDLADARNILKSTKQRLQDNPLKFDSIDFSDYTWKQHILDVRRTRFGVFKDLDRDARQDLVIRSIERACRLEEHGFDIKRVVRAGGNTISVAIPLIFKNSNLTPTAIILTLNRHNVWQISTIESAKCLTNNIKAYNFYNMPNWLREIV